MIIQFLMEEHGKKMEQKLDGDPSIITKQRWMEMYNETFEMLEKCKRFRDAINFGEGMLYFSPWADNLDTRTYLEMNVLRLCLKSGNFTNAYNYVRKWIIFFRETNLIWNIFNQIIVRTEDLRHHRFCMRRMEKDPDNIALNVLTANNWLASGNYKHALAEYARAHKKNPSEPLYQLCMGIVFGHIASQKYSSHKHSLVSQAFAFLHQYAKSREIPQEAYYNMGRCLQQLSLDHFAVHFYKTALKFPPLEVKMSESKTITYDLTSEIGFNLSLLYRKSGNIQLANETIFQYCSI